ncbi:MAG: ankyrin repeat protein [Satyrvirus sp.]|uniref:Ankyrin repeat protein n=1 Tax=Satyrvirus sp. TaxID=2487771 RepID=A0A3G5AES2_9VIRU|nr:MAG: ankyrin repeat protein [Satyrvirus sp.]
MYFKITNAKENHHGYQYKDGLNVLDKEFDDNPKNSGTAGGLYFITKEFIHNFYNYGVNLRIIELPETDPNFKMVKDPDGDKFRANKIILKEKYSLDEMETYQKFGLEYPQLRSVAATGCLNMVRYLVEKGANIHACDDCALRLAARNGHLQVVQFLVEKGANLHACDYDALQVAAQNGHLQVVQFLVEKGANIHACNDYALRLAAQNGHLQVVQFLVEKDANIHAGNDYALRWAFKNGFLEVVQCLIEKGGKYSC